MDTHRYAPDIWRLHLRVLALEADRILVDVPMNGRSDCRYAGHDWHLADGTPYQRHSQNPPGDVTVTCCWCGEEREMPAFGRAKPGTIDPSVEHGKYITGGE